MLKPSSVTCVRVWLGVLLAVFLIQAPFAAPAPTLPDGWSARDIGIVGTRGLAVGRGAAFIVRGAGTAIGDRADSFQFAYAALAGDGDIVARVTEIVSDEADATAGVMLRESLAPSARFAYMSVSAKRGPAFDRRGGASSSSTASSTTSFGVATSTSKASSSSPSPATTSAAISSTVAKRKTASSGLPPSRRVTAATIVGTAITREPESRSAASETTTSTAAGNEGAPLYLRLVRRGNVITAFKSVDGTTWTTVGSDTIPMATMVYAGLAVNNRDINNLATATFTAVRLTRGAADVPSNDVVTTQSTPLPPSNPAPSQPVSSGNTGTSSGSGGNNSTPPPSTPPPSTPPPSTPPSNSGAPDPGATVGVMQWNIHHAIGTDGVQSPDRIASWIQAIAPNVVSLNEVDTAELAEQIHVSLEARTGQTWTAWYSGVDTLLLTRLSVQATSVCTTNGTAGHYAAHLSLIANTRTVNVWSTHLSVNSAGERLSELSNLQACASQWSEARILAGDFNMQVSSPEYAAATVSYVDAWDLARANGLTINYPGNCDGCTRNSRIDYVFASQGASRLSIQSAQVFDTRDSNGITPSDHKPMLVVYAVH